MTHFIDLSGLADVKIATLILGTVDPLIDPGSVGRAVTAAVDLLDSVEVAPFDSDPLYDFRAQRPIIHYKNGVIEDVYEPAMSLDLVTDVHGERFLYVHGAEPDFHWPRLTQDILEICERFGVEKIYSFHSMPAPVPHTRPADMLIRTTKISENASPIKGEVDHPGSLADFVEFKAGQKGLSVTNIRVRVPYYLMRSEMPFFSGAATLVRQLAVLGGPTVPVGDLEQYEDQQARELSTILEQDQDFATHVKQLESEYDRSENGFVIVHDEPTDIPTSDEIGAAAEKFLEMQDTDLRDQFAPKVKEKDVEQMDLRAQIKSNLTKVFNRRGHGKDESAN